MSQSEKYIEDLSQIRDMMERSSKFISLSGLSGVFAGVYALAGALAAMVYLKLPLLRTDYSRYDTADGYVSDVWTILIIAVVVLVASLFTVFLFTIRKARKKKASLWDKSVQRLLWNIGIPLVAGGLFCLALIWKGHLELVAPATLIFYGLALINGSNYTFRDIHYLGICEIGLGLISLVLPGMGLLFWAVGFGVLHIVYGAVMHFKYDANKP